MATFFIMKIGTGDYVTAVVQSTFAAFIGMLASYGVLFFYLWKEGKLKSLFGKQAVHPDINFHDEESRQQHPNDTDNLLRNLT